MKPQLFAELIMQLPPFAFLCHKHVGLGLLGNLLLSVAQNELEGKHLENQPLD